MIFNPVTQWIDADFLRQAHINARDMSDDPSTQNGAVLAPLRSPEHLVHGANKLPLGISIPKEEIATWTKQVKYRWMCHAERSVIHLAGLRGISTLAATLYCPWFACTDCARAIIDAGITRVVGHKQMCDKLHPTWMEEIDEANVMLDMAGVKRVYIDAKLFDNNPAYEVLFRGERWIP